MVKFSHTMKRYFSHYYFTSLHPFLGNSRRKYEHPWQNTSRFSGNPTDCRPRQTFLLCYELPFRRFATEFPVFRSRFEYYVWNRLFWRTLVFNPQYKFGSGTSNRELEPSKRGSILIGHIGLRLVDQQNRRVQGFL